MSQQSMLRNRKIIGNVVLIGSYGLVAAISILVLISYCLNHTGAVQLLVVCAAGFIYLFVTQFLARRSYHYIVAWLLVLFYMALAIGIAWEWGIDTPIALLIFALVIVLAGILLTAKCALCAAAFIGLTLTAEQTTITFGWHMPDMAWSGGTSTYGDVLGFCAVFGMLALVSWLYNREMERSLATALAAEAALERQKSTLKDQVEKRTEELRQVQLLELQQMYRFSELGQLGITLLHDLANYLTALNLEIEGLKSKQHAKAIKRSREIIRYLEDMVQSTRSRLHGSTQRQTFDMARKTSDALAFLEYKATNAAVTIEWHVPPGSWKYIGDAMSYCQLVAIITNNAIDAYGPLPATSANAPKRVVAIALHKKRNNVVLTISNWGKHIAKKQRKYLFKPYHSTKKTGMGLGLYIAKQTVEMQFSGNMAIDLKSNHTEFIITFPFTHE